MKIKIKETALRLKGWSLYRLAKEMGRNIATVYKWENRKLKPTHNDIDKMCTVLGCSIGDLMEAEIVP